MIVDFGVLGCLGLLLGFFTGGHVFYRNMKALLDQAQKNSDLHASLNEKLFLIMKEVDKYIIYKSDKDDQHNQSADTKD